MRITPQNRLRAGILVWVACCIMASVQLFRDEVRIYPGYFIPIVASTEARMNQVRNSVLGAGIVSYVSNSKPFPPDTRGEAAYYLTQYALTPTVVDRIGLHDIGVGNMLNPGDHSQILSQGNWELVQSMEDGVLLLRRRSK